MAAKIPKNALYYGDNLEVLRRHIAPESVDLVYLDPPFNSDQDFNVLFKDRGSAKDSAQFRAFEDTWRWSHEAEEAFHDATKAGGPAAKALVSLRGFLHQSDMMAYLAMMAPRLVELHRVMKPTATIYLHCDPTASHYLKMLMDAVFGPANYRNEIIWKRTGAHSSSKKWGPVHDVLLYYSKSAAATWNSPRLDYDPAYLAKYYRFDDGDGRLYWRNSITAAGTRRGSSGMKWRGFDPAAQGSHWKFTIENLEALDKANKIYWPAKGGWPQIKRYRDELKGVAVSDIWDDIDRINPVGSERLGYPTQKPLALLQRILLASSNEGEVVLDPFCGCGTTIDAAQKLGRSWIGIDVTSIAINVIKHRLMTNFDARVGETYRVVGEPADLAGAEQLAKEDTHQFEHWALGLVGARASAKKKGADQGIDGRLFFYDDHGDPKEVIVSVKSGKTSSRDVRELRGVIDREKATMGVLIALQEATQPMRAEAASVGRYESPWGGNHPRLQVLSIEELLKGANVDRPPTLAVGLARKRRDSKPTTEPLFEGLTGDVPSDGVLQSDRKPPKRATGHPQEFAKKKVGSK